MNQRTIMNHLPLVRRIVRQMMGRLPSFLDQDDLISAGVIGLIHAILQFDAARGVPFEQYARIRIRGAILDELRNQDLLSRTSRDDAKKIDAAVQTFQVTHGRSPSSEELAESLGITLQKLDERKRPIRASKTSSLDARHPPDGRFRQDLLKALQDRTTPDPEAEVADARLAAAVIAACERLTVRQRLVIILHYMEGCLMNEIAEFLQVTPGRISQLHSSAIQNLRQLMSEEDRTG